MTEAPKAPEPTQLARISPWLDTAWRFGALSVGTLYVIGLLIVNIEMASYGVFSVPLARAEYILVGTMWAALSVITLCSILLGLQFLPEKRKRETGETDGKSAAYFVKIALAIIVTLIMQSITVLGAISILSQWISGPTGAPSNSPWTKAFQIAALDSGVFVVVVGYQGLTSALYSKGSGNLWSKFGGYGYLLFNSTVLLILALVLYTKYVFPVIPQAIGGGLRPLVYVMLADPPGFDLGLPMVEKKVGPVAMLGESSTMYFVLGPREDRLPVPWRLSDPSARAVGIEKRLVVALVPAVLKTSKEGSPH
jgi:hypothetical protein